MASSSKQKNMTMASHSVSFPALFLVLAAILIATNVEKALLASVDETFADERSLMSVTPFDQVAGVLLAQGSTPGPTPGSTPGGSGAGITNPIKATTLAQFLEQILAVVIQIGYLVAVFFIVYSGFKFVTAQGNESEVTKAKMMLLYTVIGTAILIGAHVISAAIQATVTSLSA
jgi:hypothetical protein